MDHQEGDQSGLFFFQMEYKLEELTFLQGMNVPFLFCHLFFPQVWHHC